MANPRKKTRRPPRVVHQFLIVLCETDPLVWRRIQVPEVYSLWDLHVAIQDSMGWLDRHLHEFRIVDPESGRMVSFGIPGDYLQDPADMSPGWDATVTDCFHHHGHPALYVYDFGDDWRHVVVYEGVQPTGRSIGYPRCAAGERACPPEDCGGPLGFSELLQAISDPRHPEHEDMLDWAGGDFDPDRFSAADVVFADPEKRWQIAFGPSRR